MRDHELEDIYDRLHKLTESLKETVEIVRKLQDVTFKEAEHIAGFKSDTHSEFDVDVDEDGPFKVTANTEHAQVIGKVKTPSLVPGGTEEN